MTLLGCHVSVSGGYYRAVERGEELGCSAIQIFTRNQLRWSSKRIDEEDIVIYKKFLSESTKIKLVFAHGSYLFNFASPDRKIIKRSTLSILDELERCFLLNLPFLVIHPGHHKGLGEDIGIHKIVASLKTVLNNDTGNTMVCIETTAGQGTGLGYRFEHIRDIIQGIESDRIGACIDTCHIFASGYDIRTFKEYKKTVELFDRVVGLSNLKVIHLNDSKGSLASRIDRHMHIGEGHIGRDAFKYFIQDERFEAIPKVIETPKKLGGREMDSFNLEILREFTKDL